MKRKKADVPQEWQVVKEITVLVFILGIVFFTIYPFLRILWRGVFGW